MSNTHNKQGTQSMSNELKTMDEIQAETAVFELRQREAKVFAASDLVPTEYQGKTANVLIAMNLARRCRMDPFEVMQNLYVIHGKPGWSAKFLLACINESGIYGPLIYEFQHDDDGKETACRVTTTHLPSGEPIAGPEVSMEMAKTEGWLGKSGSKWKSMPGMMLRYRAVAFFHRTCCPEIGLGMHTVDELRDADDNDAPKAMSADAFKKMMDGDEMLETADTDTTETATDGSLFDHES